MSHLGHRRYQCYSKNLFRVVSIAQLVEVTVIAVLGGVVLQCPVLS